jgi:hypothetical protein
MARRFPGLVSADGESSVIVSEIPERLGEVRAGFNEQEIVARGMQWRGSEPVRIDGLDGVLVRVDQPVESSRELRRWVAVFGSGDRGVLITASTLADLEGPMDEVLEGVLLTAEWDPDAVIDPYLELGFWVGETASLKISDRLPTMIAFTRDGRRGAIESDEPLLLAGSSVTLEPPSDLERFGERLLMATKEVEGAQILTSRSLELDGLRAYEVTAAGNDRDTGAPLRVHQTVIVDGDRYYLIQGLVGVDAADEFMPQFRQVSESFRRAP